MNDPSTADPGAARRPQSTRAERVIFVVLASLFQGVVVFMTAVMGLGWGGLTYTTATTQSMLAFPIIALLVRRPPWPLIVPLLSAALTGALMVVGAQTGDLGA